MWSVKTSMWSVSGLRENMMQIDDFSCNCSYAVEPNFEETYFYPNVLLYSFNFMHVSHKVALPVRCSVPTTR